MPQGQFQGPPEVSIVFDGQSLLNVPLAPANSASRAMQGRPYRWVNVSINGTSWTTHQGTAATRLWPQAVGTVANIHVMNGGQQDVFDGDTGATIYDDACDYAEAAKANGFTHTVLCTLPAMGPDMLGSGWPTGPMSTAIASFNSLVVANSRGVDEVVRLDLDPLDDATDPTYFLVDRLHPSAAGAQVIGDRMWTAISAVLDSL